MIEETDFSVERKLVHLSDGARITLRRWGGAKPLRIVISHGNGLAIDGFTAFGRELMNHFEVVAFDMRNHGQSGPGEVLDDPWPRYLTDIPEIFDAIQNSFGQKPTHGAFHSLSSASTIMAQGLDPRPWKTLTLYEPPVPPVNNPILLDAFQSLHATLSARTRSRRRRFADPARLIASLERSQTFGGIPAPQLNRLAEAMLIRTDADPNAPWDLVCAPEMEANTFDTRRACDFYEGIARVQTPVQVVVGTTLGHDMPILIKTAELLAATFGFKVTCVEGGGHLMQLQRPNRSAEHAVRFALNR
ncbi:MAG: hypothetical protein VR71_11550 [Roseovarius sp. BRH_c41]|uniref:alpha/beta fold hydrolase n=1 Tax=Roseovarius sp. BRH_c41 TaxID=1629709 RepID=UPI0005F0D1A7|nr:alpha/beta hydrolase [Roseovarius sp. BRH_c41]KJS43097.1 MAG: hypothetical protein VR71_11550 [Roseovarius sp. BRH_c41]